jgi:tetratricopeptide (TPR) repeat protein
LGNEYFQKGIYKQAVLFMQKALSLDAENQEAISLLGKIFIVTGKKDEVFKLMRRLEQNSSVNGLQALQGFKSQMIKQFLKNKMYQDAYQMAKKEIDQNRGNHAHYEALGISLLQMGRHRAALDFLEKSRNLNPKAAKYPMPSFEEKKKELGDISQKITQLENTLVHRDSQTQDSESHFDLGFLYFYNGEHKKALHSFKSALDLKLRAI